MQTFIIEAANRPGELARMAELVAGRGINVEAFSLGHGSKGAVAFLAHDEKGLRDAFEAEGIGYQAVPVLTISLEDRPGTIAKAARRLADAGVNIEFLAPVDFTSDRRATIVIGVDKIDVARNALSDQLTEWRIPEKVFAGSATS